MTLTSTSFRRPKVGFIEAASGTGMKVTASANLTLAVAAGNAWLGGKRIVFAGANTTLNTADAALARIDAITVNDSGTILNYAGTPAASPTAPFVPDGELLLARVAVAAGATTINTADITDLRDFGGFSVDGTTISISSAGVISVIPAGITGFPTVLASGSGNTSIVGNGADQTVVADTFTALANSDSVMVISKQSFTRTAGAGTVTNYTVLLDAVQLVKQGASDGNSRIQRTHAQRGSGSRGYLIVEENQEGTTGTAGITVSKVTTHTAASAAFSILAEVPAATTFNVEYSYVVLRMPGGI